MTAINDTPVKAPVSDSSFSTLAPKKQARGLKLKALAAQQAAGGKTDSALGNGGHLKSQLKPVAPQPTPVIDKPAARLAKARDLVKAELTALEIHLEVAQKHLRQARGPIVTIAADQVKILQHQIDLLSTLMLTEKKAEQTARLSQANAAYNDVQRRLVAARSDRPLADTLFRESCKLRQKIAELKKA